MNFANLDMVAPRYFFDLHQLILRHLAPAGGYELTKLNARCNMMMRPNEEKWSNNAALHDAKGK